MLTDALGIRLIFWLGKILPTPAPRRVLEALRSVEVTSDVEQGDGFQLTFELAKSWRGDFDLLDGGALSPWNRVVLGVQLGTSLRVLCDGVITHHQLQSSSEGQDSAATLTVTGTSLAVLLDQSEVRRKYPNQPDAVIAAQILARYARYGLVPDVRPTGDIPLSIQRVPWQHETDLACLERMAERNAFVFYIEPVTMGIGRAYFGPDNRLSVPQKALTVDMGGSSNVTSLHFSHDAALPQQSTGRFYAPGTQTTLPVPTLPALRIPPLALRPTTAKRQLILRDAAKLNLSQAMQRARGLQAQSGDSVRGQGELDSVRYGDVLRARRLVGVRGAGRSYDGLYYVGRVTHHIERGKYTQSFALRREGTGSLTPVVRP